MRCALAQQARQVLVPLYRRAAWPLQRVLTDGSFEFKAAFAEACRALGIRHTRTLPRHAWTNGFVERLQGTIVHEHWHRVSASVLHRRRAMQRSLDGFMEFYNEQRPHKGHRLRGPTPAELFVAWPVWRADVMTCSGKADVSTPFRVLTP